MVSKALRDSFNWAASRCFWRKVGVGRAGAPSQGSRCRNRMPVLASLSVLSYLLVYSRKREAVGGSDFSRGFVFASN